MIHVITAENRARYHARDGAGGDASDAVQLLAIDEDGRIGPGLSVIPTTSQDFRSGKAGVVFGEAAPCDPRIWCVLGWTPAPSPAPEGSASDHELVCGLFEFAASRGVTHYLAIWKLQWLAALEAFGWPWRPVDLQHMRSDDTASVTALLIEANPKALARFRRLSGLRESVLHEAPPSERSGGGRGAKDRWIPPAPGFFSRTLDA